MIGDARIARPNQYDTVICFFLLHEVPEEAKADIVSALLASAKVGGKIVFVDYHKPSKWHPLKFVMSKVFDWLEPFAKELWEKEIEDYRVHTPGFTWHKETLFGGLYQKVVVEKR
jgi:2-polyprenyl-3-methyl-5-hydroxy-6-metoxy-1,4-benzoquinol methylase